MLKEGFFRLYLPAKLFFTVLRLFPCTQINERSIIQAVFFIIYIIYIIFIILCDIFYTCRPHSAEPCQNSLMCRSKKSIADPTSFSEENRNIQDRGRGLHETNDLQERPDDLQERPGDLQERQDDLQERPDDLQERSDNRYNDAIAIYNTKSPDKDIDDDYSDELVESGQKVAGIQENFELESPDYEEDYYPDVDEEVEVVEEDVEDGGGGWEVGPWTSCSAVCGEGITVR
jgi:hypothetical protein